MKYLKKYEDVNDDLLINIASELSNKMICDEFGSCVHFAEEFVIKIHDINPYLLNQFYVIEGYVDWEFGDDIPQQHTWIELKDGTKIDPTFEQFTRYGWSEYNKRIKNKYTGLKYYQEIENDTWFIDQRKKYPEKYFKL